MRTKVSRTTSDQTGATPPAGNTQITANSIVVDHSSLAAGQTATVTFSFSAAVSGFEVGDVSVPSGTLSGLTSSDGGSTWTATLTPNVDVEKASNQITVNLAGITDAAGNAGSGTSVPSGNYAVDTKPPALATATVNGDQLVIFYT